MWSRRWSLVAVLTLAFAPGSLAVPRAAVRPAVTRTGTVGSAGAYRNMERQSDARQVLERAIRAKGGADVLRAVKTIVMTGTMTVAGPKPTVAQFTNYIEYPDRFRQDARLPGEDVTQVYAHGETWMKDVAGVRDVPPAARPNLAGTVSRDVISLLLSAADGKLQAQVVPASGPGGEGIDDLRLSGANVAPVDLLVDRTTGMITGKRYVVEQPGAVGKVPTVEQYSDYRNVSGLQVAFRTVVRRGEATIMEQTLTDFRVNVPVAASMFTRPPQ